MDLIGRLFPRAVCNSLDKQAWIALIDRHPNLARPEPRLMINPFNRKPMMVGPRADAARIIIEGAEVGGMEWFLDGESGINVWGQSTAVISVAEDIANTLGAEFRRWELEGA
jgi:hypothetical protein